MFTRLLQRLRIWLLAKIPPPVERVGRKAAPKYYSSECCRAILADLELRGEEPRKRRTDIASTIHTVARAEGTECMAEIGRCKPAGVP